MGVSACEIREVVDESDECALGDTATPKGNFRQCVLESREWSNLLRAR